LAGTGSGHGEPMSTPTSDAILFDIDGTLMDSTYHHALAWHRSFARVGLTVPMWRIHRTIGMGGDKLVAEVAGEDAEKEHGDTLRDAWHEEYAKIVDEVPPLPGAAELVRELAEQGYQVALASSGAADFSKGAVGTLGVEESIAALTTADDAEESKPEPDILSVTLKQLDAERAVLIGDTPYDVDSARRIGLQCIAVLTGGYSHGELTESGAALVVDDLTQLAGLDWSGYLSPINR
jgi:HAD superfamily hydrolase (TIGR01549 family)